MITYKMGKEVIMLENIETDKKKFTAQKPNFNT